MIKLVECPRDAMQGIHDFIPTDDKIRYLQALLEVGFDTLDFGSFVSAKAIPQLQDTAEVLSRLDLSGTKTKLLAIVANVRGAEDACRHEAIAYLGYPFSLSETFQQRNTNRSVSVAFDDVKRMQELALAAGKQMVVYFSMGFGNPYGDPWNAEVVDKWLADMIPLGITIFSLADTVGTANAGDIGYIFSSVLKRYPALEIGAHFHSRPEDQRAKIEAAYQNGCRRFDAAMLGFGGCPMAEDELVGNLSTEAVVRYFDKMNVALDLNKEKFDAAREIASDIFSKYR